MSSLSSKCNKNAVIVVTVLLSSLSIIFSPFHENHFSLTWVSGSASFSFSSIISVQVLHSFYSPIIMVGRNFKICQIFVRAKFFLTFVGELNVYRGVIFVTTPSLFHSLETANTQKSEVFLLSIPSGKLNAVGVITCRYNQIY